MINCVEVEALSPEERDLLENFRQTKADKRASLLLLSSDYRRVFPAEVVRLRLVATGEQANAPFVACK